MFTMMIANEHSASLFRALQGAVSTTKNPVIVLFFHNLEAIVRSQKHRLPGAQSCSYSPQKFSKTSYRELVLFIDAPIAPNNDRFHR
jgi:hypothetical protein